MTERGFEKQKNHFILLLEQSGFRVIETSNEKVSIEVPEGRFHIVTGFPEFNPRDKRFFYGNNVVGMQHKPLELDFDSAIFRSFSDEFKRKIGFGQSLDETISVLDDLVQSSIESDSEDERITNMSQILQKGRSACAGKALVSAGLLKALDLKPEVQLVYGASSQFDNKRPHNIGHVWLRISAGDSVILYDPYFGHIMSYKLPEPTTIEQDPFGNYSVGAYFAANIINQLSVKSFGREYAKLVEETSGSKSMWVPNERALASQVFGEMDFEFETKSSGNLTFVNGGLFSARKGGAGFNYPLRKIFSISEQNS